jgi:transcriptional regulator
MPTCAKVCRHHSICGYWINATDGNERKLMYRKDLIPMLLGQARSVAELAHMLYEAPKDVEVDLQHLLKSLKRTSYHAVIEPATCRHCGFVFQHGKLRKPGKCPQCKGTWISEPRVGIEEK